MRDYWRDCADAVWNAEYFVEGTGFECFIRTRYS